MLNPYTLLTPELLKAMTRQPMYFVRQYYQRGIGNFDAHKIPLLFSHYSHVGIDKERAYRHFELIKNDRYRYLYDSTKQVDANKLVKASYQPVNFKIYTNLLIRKWIPPKEVREKVGRYLKEKFSLESDLVHQSIKIDLQDLFGKLYLRISWKGTRLEVLLDEVENIYENVL